jgi:hypothetical protein
MKTVKSKSDCTICKYEHEFEVDDELVNDFTRGDVAIFAGSGISTESRNVLKFTFYDEIAGELNKKSSSLSFPDLMEEYCKLPNGRYKLLEKIRERFRHINSFPELEIRSSRFHQELATLYPIQTIVTTNWDTYFEDYCDSTPFVTDSDLAFWNSSRRRVLKIHGSINNYGSIVATKSDYKKSKRSLTSGIMGSVLKTILATQTVVFMGYSLSDSDFNNIYDFVLKQMKGLHKQAYIVTPFKEDDDILKKKNLKPIITDGTYFINQMKLHAINQGMLVSDDIYSHASSLLLLLKKEHSKLHEKYDCFKHPQMIYTTSYQDGMMHALERALQLRKSGEYSHSCNIASVIDPYLEIQKDKRKNKNYEDVAYIEGYINSLTYILLRAEDNNHMIPPLYFAFGVNHDLMNHDDFKKVLHKLPEKHKASYKVAVRSINKLLTTKGIRFHHPPWL